MHIPTLKYQSQSVSKLYFIAAMALFAGQISVGRLCVSGAATDESGFGYLAEFLDALRPFEVQLHDLLQVDYVGQQKSSGEIPAVQSQPDSAEIPATV